MYQNLVDILDTLNINLSFIEDIPLNDELIVFSIEKENNYLFSDNSVDGVLYKFKIAYKYKDISNIDKYKAIKELLKTNGYIFKNASDDFDGENYIKNMMFEYLVML